MVLVMLMVFLFVIITPSTLAHEYFGGLFTWENRDGISSGTYNISHASSSLTYNGRTFNFYKAYNDAMYDWNYRTISNLWKDNNTTGKLNFYGDNYGNFEAYGWVNFYNWDGTRANPDCTACAPESNWDYANIALNAYTLERDNISDYNVYVTEEHEIGHGLGLAHEDDVPSVMQTYGFDWLIQNDDVNGVWNLYNNP